MPGRVSPVTGTTSEQSSLCSDVFFIKTPSARCLAPPFRLRFAALDSQPGDRTIGAPKGVPVFCCAEASLQINGVFQAAEAAAAQYLENIRSLSTRQEEVCRKREAECAAKCEAMCAQAERECRRKQRSADEYWELMTERLREFYDEHHGLRELMTKVEDQNDEETQP